MGAFFCDGSNFRRVPPKTFADLAIFSAYMAPLIPDEIPSRFASGTTVKFHRSFGDYLASDGWTYTFYANGASAIFNQAATTNPDGQSFDIVIPASKTQVPAGRYQCAERLVNTLTSEVVDPNDDTIEILIEADVATASAGAFISHIERTLAVIEAAIEERLSADLESYQIAGRQVTKIAAKELLWFRGHYRSKLFQLQNPGRLGSTAKVAFTIEDDPGVRPTWVDVTGLDR